MRIAKILAKNYRTLEDAAVIFGNNYCTISGKNNAGKSCIIRLLSALMSQASTPWSDCEIEYEEDKTQWLKDSQDIEITYEIVFSKADDSAFVVYIERMSGASISENEFSVIISLKYGAATVESEIVVNGAKISPELNPHVLQKIKTSNLLFLHNSTSQEDSYFGHGRRQALVEFVLSDQERKQILDAEVQIQSKIKKFARQHKDELQTLLLKLEEKHSVEFATLAANYARHIPLGVRLQDRNVDVPINNWGSGTQNKTYILLSILWANRIKTQGKDNEKITPVVVIEEPESFLHPSAQAEFGKLLSGLASDLGIQIIVTTHSPYMLNRHCPSSNLLIRRQEKNAKHCATEVVVPSGSDWMLPFSDHLGIPSGEFQAWAPIFGSDKRRILLVEGAIDKEYLDFLRDKKWIKEQLPPDLEVVPYGGKDALKNTVLLKFTLEKYDEAYITFDLDALSDVKRAIEAIGFKENVSYFPIGQNIAGHRDIEGLLPQSVRSRIFADNTSLVTQAIGGDRDSKEKLKKLYLDEFKGRTDYSEEDLKHFSELFKKINKGVKSRQASSRKNSG